MNFILWFPPIQFCALVLMICSFLVGALLLSLDLVIWLLWYPYLKELFVRAVFVPVLFSLAFFLEVFPAFDLSNCFCFSLRD